MLLQNAQIMHGILVLCAFYSIFTETQCNFSGEEGSKYIRKKIGATEYLVKITFSTYSGVVKNDTLTTTATTTTSQKLGNGSEFVSNDYLFGLICDDVHFECKSDNQCIPIEQYCDGKNDCIDSSDEVKCATAPTFHFSNETPSIASSKNLIIIIIIILSVF